MNRTRLYAAFAAGFSLSAGWSGQGLAQAVCDLEIAPGAVIAGASNEDFIVIEQGCRILAEGTAEQPILFTAIDAVTGEVEDNARGLWGGLVINGRAPINDCPEGIEGGTAECTKEGEANSGLFGGDQPADDSGVLNYVVVSYAGSNVDPENQLNGIAFQGVGSGTVVDYVQVHNNLDDGIEFFGGTVSARHVALTGNADDSLDWTDGWTGNIQYLYIEQTDSADNLIEADNREGDEDLQPRSAPAISNFSGFGNPAENGLRLRRGTGLRLTNTIITDSDTCIQVDGSSRDLLGTELTIAGTSFNCNETHSNDVDGAVEAYLDTAEEVSQTGEPVNAVMPDGDFFETTDFVGAFGDEIWTDGWTLEGTINNVETPAFACPAGTTQGEDIAGLPSCLLSGTYTSDLILTRGGYYVLDGKVTIGGDNTDSASLTLRSGVTLVGDDPEDFLVISRGSQIFANGDASAPVIMTAIRDVEGDDLTNVRGLWGGLVINGNAPINDCPEGIEGGTAECTKEGEANSGLFGGDQPGDDSGSINYLVVKHAGSNVDPENQLNGIAFQGVGSGTEVNFVQVHNNLDDGIEYFGGTASARYVVLTGNADDSLDWTDGWTGNIQWLYIEQTDSADNLFEADNREGDEDLEPRSNPSISNFSGFGSPSENGLRLRRGTGLALTNSIVSGSATCIQVDGRSRELLGTDLTIAGTSFDCAETHSNDDDGAVEAYLDGAEEVSQVGGPVNPVMPEGDFFEATDYVGAIGDVDWTMGWTVPGSVNNTEPPEFACPAGTTDNGTLAGMPSCLLSGTIISDLTLTRGGFYVLDGKVTVGGDNTDSAVLSIQAGVTVVGDDPEDFLVISRGSQIMANGTNANPVTLTAVADVEGGMDLTNVRGLWGGLVINGNAPINDCPEGAVGGTVECTKEGEANSGLFGGASPDESSGVLNYVVVKYAGSNVDPENQLNGIAFQGVGSGTEIDFVQVHNNLDDGIEFFGGTADAKHIVLSGNADDSLDWTDGWTGRVQYLHIVQAVDSADNLIEADNREGDEDLEPRSNPTISNMTGLGSPTENGLRLRRGTGLALRNSVVSGSEVCIRVDGTSRDLLGSQLTVESTGLDCAELTSDDADSAVADYIGTATNVTTDGSTPPAADLPDDGFFEPTDVVGSDFDSWRGTWVFGL